MASIYDVDQQKLIVQLAGDLKKIKEISMPDWARFVKTGAHNERPPAQEDWWHTRSASILKSVFKNGPVGVSKLRSRYGGRKNRGSKPHKFYKSSGKVIRVMLQQLESAGLITQSNDDLKKGRVITSKGQAMLDNAANKVAGVSKKSAPKKEEKKEEKK